MESDQNDNVTVNPDEVLAPGVAEAKPEDENTDYISQPAKVMRIGSMVKSLLDEARAAPLDEAGRARLREIYEMSIAELSARLRVPIGVIRVVASDLIVEGLLQAACILLVAPRLARKL